MSGFELDYVNQTLWLTDQDSGSSIPIYGTTNETALLTIKNFLTARPALFSVLWAEGQDQ